ATLTSFSASQRRTLTWLICVLSLWPTNSLVVYPAKNCNFTLMFPEAFLTSASQIFSKFFAGQSWELLSHNCCSSRSVWKRWQNKLRECSTVGSPTDCFC